MQQAGLNINIIKRTTSNASYFAPPKNRIFCEATELCLLLYELEQESSKIRVIRINFHVAELDIYTAYDIAIAIKECKKKNIQFVGFSETLTLSHFIAICFCDFRVCPPLAGPLTFSINFKHFILNENYRGYFQSVKIGIKKSPLIEFTSEKIDETKLEQEKALGDEIISKCVALILNALPQKRDLKNAYSTAVEMAECNLLTHVCYEEYLIHNIKLIENIKWKYRAIQKVNLNSYLSKLTQFFKRIFYILEIKSSYWDELNLLVELRQQLQILFNRNNTSGLLIIVNHKGGSYELADRIYCLINVLIKRFPVYVYIKVAASSGYCIASAGEKIYINPCGYLGDVGTVLVSPNYDYLLSRLGIDVVNNLTSPIGADNQDANIMYARSQIAFTLFINRIAESRKMEIEMVENIMDGSTFGSTQSVLNRFADSEMTLISILRNIEIANGKKPYFVFIKKSESLFIQAANRILPKLLLNAIFK